MLDRQGALTWVLRVGGFSFFEGQRIGASKSE